MAYVVQSSPVVISKSFSYTELGLPATYTLTHTFGLTGTVVIKDNTASGRQLALPQMAITGTTFTTTLWYDAANQLVQYQSVNGSYYVYTTFDFSQRTDGGAKITYQWSLASPSTGKISVLASKSLAAGTTVFGDGSINPKSGAFQGLGFDWTDILSAYSPTYNGGQLTLTLPASGEIDPATVGTTTAWNPIAAPKNSRQPMWVAATGLWWMVWSDGTNLVYSSCASLTGTWATKATAISGISNNYYGVCTDGTYIHLTYQIGATLHYIQCVPTSGGSLGVQTDRTIVSSGLSTSGNPPSICVSSDNYVCIGYCNSSYYPIVIRNSNQASSNAWSNASGFPVTLVSTAYYSPAIAPAPSGVIHAVYEYGSVLYFKTVSTAGSLGSQESASLNGVNDSFTYDLVVDLSSGTTYIVYYSASSDFAVRTRARTSGGTWDGSEVNHASYSGTYDLDAGIQIDTATGNVYVTWCDNSNNVYYDKWNGSAWSGATLLTNENTDGGLSNIWFGGPLTTQNGTMVVCYVTKASSPYNLKVAGLVLASSYALTGTVAITSGVSGTVLDNANWILSGAVVIASSVSGTAIDTGNYVLVGAVAIASAVIGTAYDNAALGGVVSITSLVSGTIIDNANWVLAGTMSISSAVTGTVLDNANWVLSGSLAIASGVTGTVIDNSGWILSGTISISSSVTGSIIDNVVWVLSGILTIVSGVNGSVIDSGAVIFSPPGTELRVLLGNLIMAQYGAGQASIYWTDQRRECQALIPLIKVYPKPNKLPKVKGIGYGYRAADYHFVIDIKCLDETNADAALTEVIRILGRNRVSPFPGYDEIDFSEGNYQAGGAGFYRWTVDTTIRSYLKPVAT